MKTFTYYKYDTTKMSINITEIEQDPMALVSHALCLRSLCGKSLCAQSLSYV